MGLFASFAFHARDRHGARCDDDRREAAPKLRGRRRAGLAGGLILAAATAAADPLRIAYYNTELSRSGPGELLADIASGETEDVAQIVGVVAEVAPDVLVLSGIDYDENLSALRTLAARLSAAGVNYTHHFARAPNSGMATGIDLDGDGRLGTARDAQGYGQFAGQGGLAVLSRYPIAGVADYSALLWSDLPGNVLEDGVLPHAAIARQRLSSVAHWVLHMRDDTGREFDLCVFHATPPVFDGPEDRNGRRNHDETAFWLRYLDGTVGEKGQTPFVIASDANIDPVDGEGRRGALQALLAHPAIQDVRPASAGAVAAAARDGGANTAHLGDPATDTVDWRDDGAGPGNLRVDYVLPSADWQVAGAGVFWPAPDAPKARLLGGDGGATRHRLVWVDLMF